MEISISKEEIEELVRKNEINNESIYLKNPNVMYIAIQIKPELISLIDFKTLEKVAEILKSDHSLSLEERKKITFDLIARGSKWTKTLGYLIDSEELYLEFASSSFDMYYKLYIYNHNYKKLEEKLFYDLYEKDYVNNGFGGIHYGKKSPKVLLNTIKQSGEEQLRYFREEAFDEEVIEYIENNDLIDYVDSSILYNNRIPKLTDLKLKKDRSFISSLIRNNELTDDFINYLETINFNFDDMVFLQKSKKDYFRVLENSRLRSILYETSFGKTGELVELLKILNIFGEIFALDEINVIIREIVANNYVIDFKGILDNIEISKFGELYNKLSEKENKFNKEFNFYYFIKITEYLANNIALVRELNNCELTDDVINNLALAINNDDKVNYSDLLEYQTIYKKRIQELENVSNYDKLSRLLVGKDSKELEKFIENCFNVNQILYLQLTFKEDSYEYQLLENYLNIIGALEKARDDEVFCKQLLDKFDKTFILNPILNLNVMRENVLRLFALMYQNITTTYDKLKEQGNFEKIGNVTIYHLDNCDFSLFAHDLDFNTDEDSTGLDDIKEIQYVNYICTSVANEIYPNFLDGSNHTICYYEFSNPNTLIAFANKDAGTYYTKAPLIRSNNSFVNPIDISFIDESRYRGYTRSEFVFLRKDSRGNTNKQFPHIYSSKDEILRKGTDNEREVVVFDPKVNKQYLQNKFEYLCDNIQTLNYQELYKLIALSTKFSIDEIIINEIVARINELSEKEQCVLKYAMSRYNISSNSKNK